jgi:oligoendopeptidase F
MKKIVKKNTSQAQPKKGKSSVPTEWNLQLFYTSDTDPQIEKDIADVERLCDSFEKKYRMNDQIVSFWESAASLKSALTAYEVLYSKIGSAKPLMYFYYKSAVNTADPLVNARIQQISERYTRAGNKTIFFDVALSKIDTVLQKKYLSDPLLKKYSHYLSRVFLSGKHTLTEAEEKVLSLKGQTDGMWVDGVERALNKRMVTFKGKKMPINEAIPKVASLEHQRDRQELWKSVTAELKTLHDFTESELNAFYTNKKISDEMRGYKNPYDATLLSHETSEKTVFALVDAVSKRFDVSQRFFTLKKKMLKLKTMRLEDCTAPLGKPEKMTFEEGFTTVRDAYTKLDPRYGKIFTDAFENGQVDVFARQNKSGGGFQSKSLNLPGMILLNYVPDFKSALTLAHEVGHLIHSTRTESEQPVFYRDYSTTVAEVASTFGEAVLFYSVFDSLSHKEKVHAMHEYLLDTIVSVFRCIADFNAEHRYHTTIREKGWMSMDELLDTYVDTRKDYGGKALTLTRDDGYRIVYTSHFRLKYYLYSYAFGRMVSRILYERVQKDPSYIAKVDEFLSAGSSATTEDIFKKIGIDVTSPTFFDEGIAAIEKDIDAFEALISKKK